MQAPIVTTIGAAMDGDAFDFITRRISRRGVAALLGTGLLVRGVATTSAKVGRCGGAPNIFTKHCKSAGSCETDDDCAEGCACVERRQGCCYKEKKRKKRNGVSRVRCIDGRPGLYCFPASNP